MTLSKGSQVLLSNGWYATLLEKPRNVLWCLAQVEGFQNEAGSVLIKDIVGVKIEGLKLPGDIKTTEGIFRPINQERHVV